MFDRIQNSFLITNQKQAYRNSWTLDTSVWTLDSGCWTLDSGR